MAAVKARGDTIALISGNQIKLHELSQNTSCILHLPETANNTENNQNDDTEDPPTITAGDDKNPSQTKKEDNAKSKKNNHSNQLQTDKKDSSANNSDLGPNRTLSATISDSGKLLAVSDDRKQLHLYQKSNNSGDDDATTTTWTLLSSRSVVRRSSCVLFTCDEKMLILGDKSGDVYKFSVIEPIEPGVLMMGHLSMLLDMVLADSDRYLITCDRDEKIRLSHFPNTYNIHCYCLGHSDFLTRLMYLPHVEAIISGGGDGTIRSWDLEGKNLHCLDHGVTRSQENEEESNNADSSTNNNNNNTNSVAVKCMTFDQCSKTLAVSFDQSTTLQVYKIIKVSGQQRLEIKLCDQRQLPAEPWDIQFLKDSQLLVLLPLQETAVLLFDCSTFNEESSVDPKITEVSQGYLQQHPKIRDFLKTVNSDWEFFEPSMKIESFISSLPKSRIDNMSDYQERKEQQVKKKFQPKGKRKEQDSKGDKCQLLEGQEPSAKAIKVDK